MNIRATHAEVDIAQLKKNIQIFKNILGGKPLCFAVKGNAYGHGIVTIAQYTKDLVDVFAVATIQEGVELRQGGIENPILVLSAHLDREIPLFCNYRLTPIISHSEHLKKYQECASHHSEKLPIHIKVDTGMGRSGAMPSDILAIAQGILSYPNLILEGICTHFAMSDNINSDFTDKQLDTFNQVVQLLKDNNISIPQIHAANTEAILNYPQSHFTMGRLGIGAYGYSFYEGISPILSLKSKITISKTIPKGHAVSYGCTWIASKDTVIGIVPAGYADGYIRALSNKAYVLVDGIKCPVIGNVSMDQIVIELPYQGEWLEKDVLLYGNDKELNANLVAEWANTIPYEVLTSITDRVPRVYI